MMRAATLLLSAALLLPLGARAADDADVARLQGRLSALQADPQLGRLAAYEQVEARQALAALAEARRADRPAALYLAERRIEIAEVVAATSVIEQEARQLELQRGQLLLEASRREAERARQETEKLRIQAQIQAEETERLRLAAEAEAAARSDVEQTLSNVTGRQTAQLSAARRKEAELSRQEAELVSGAKLPPSSFGSRGEVFSVAGNAFAQGKSALTGDGKAAVSALAAYLQIAPRSKVRIEAYDTDSKVAQARTESLRKALVAAGVANGRIQAAPKKGASTAKRSAEVVVSD